MKRYLYIFITVAGLALVGLAVYYFLTNTFGVAVIPMTPGGLPNPGGSTTPGTPPTPSSTTTPLAPAYTGANGQKFGVIAENQVAAYYVDGQNNVILVQPDGQVIKIVNGNATTLSSSAVSGLANASFSYDGNKILTTFGDSQNPQVSVFDVQNKSWGPLAQKIHSPVWSPTNNQIIYLVNKSDGYAITTLDLANSKAKPVELMKIRGEDLLLDWTNPSQVIIYQKPSTIVEGSSWVFNVKNKTLTPLLSSKFGLQLLWEKTTNVGLISEDTTGGPALSLVGANGETLRDLSLATLPIKCVFEVALPVPTPSSTITVATSTKNTALPPPVVSVYCALPRDIEKFQLADLPDDYNKKKLFTVDDFYKIGLGDGNLAEVFVDPAQALDATNLFVANQTLFFVNRYDQKLYAISLK